MGVMSTNAKAWAQEQDQIKALALVAEQQPDPTASFAFTPVPRKTCRFSGLNPLKQQAFIAHLASSGSVTMAARATGHDASPWYQLRMAPGAEEFAVAWDRAVDAGARRVLDTLVEHAIHGTPETIIQNGEVIAERRRYNHRAMMWIVAHRFPDRFGGVDSLETHHGLPSGLKKLKQKWHAEWQVDAEAAREAAQPSDDQLCNWMLADIEAAEARVEAHATDDEQAAAFFASPAWDNAATAPSFPFGCLPPPLDPEAEGP